MVYNYFMAVYFFYGEEDFNIDLELEAMRSKLNPDFLSMSYQVFDSPDFQTFINAVRTTPMMFGNMLIIIDSTNYFFDKKKKSWLEDKELSELEEALDGVSDCLDIVFTVRAEKIKRLTQEESCSKFFQNITRKSLIHFSHINRS